MTQIEIVATQSVGAVMQDHAAQALRALKLKKGVVDRLRVEAWQRHALLRFENSMFTICAVTPPTHLLARRGYGKDNPLAFHAVTIGAKVDFSTDLIVDFWTLKEVIENAQPERIDFQIEYVERDGNRIPYRLLLRSYHMQIHLPLFPVAEFPFGGEITLERADSSEGLLTYHNFVLKPYKALRKRKADNRYAISKSPVDGKWRSNAYAGTSVLAWVERDQARRLKIRQAEHALELPKAIHSVLTDSSLRSDIDFRDALQRRYEYTPISPLACIDTNGDLVIRTSNNTFATSTTIFHFEADFTVYHDETAYTDGTIYSGYKTRLEATLTRAEVIAVCTEWDKQFKLDKC